MRPLPVVVFGLTFPTVLNFTFFMRFVYSYAVSQENGGFLCRDKIQKITTVYGTWRRDAVFVNKCNIFNRQDSFYWSPIIRYLARVAGLRLNIPCLL
jgi:hypothetical protein